MRAVRDVTATVESLDLITASILSKKLAAGLEGLVLDVKCGSGAFMETAEDARALARSLVETANGAGGRTAALVTDMDQPLAPTAGNALEVASCMEVFEGADADGRLARLTIDLVADLLVMADAQPDLDASRVAVYGASYGGYMTLASAVHFSDRLKAVIDNVGISNFVTFLKNTSAYRRDLRRVEYGDERKIGEFLNKIIDTQHHAAGKVDMLLRVGSGGVRSGGARVNTCHGLASY